jgi:hypothetical protein
MRSMTIPTSSSFLHPLSNLVDSSSHATGLHLALMCIVVIIGTVWILRSIVFMIAVSQHVFQFVSFFFIEWCRWNSNQVSIHENEFRILRVHIQVIERSDCRRRESKSVTIILIIISRAFPSFTPNRKGWQIVRSEGYCWITLCLCLGNGMAIGVNLNLIHTPSHQVTNKSGYGITVLRRRLRLSLTSRLHMRFHLRLHMSSRS